MIKPDFYSKGKEYQKLNDDVTKKIKKEIDEVKKNNGKVIYTDEVTFSSSKILNDFQLYLNKNQTNELKNLKKKYNFDNIRNKFQKFKKLKVLVIGELIVDKYNYCEPLGKSGKDPIMMFKKMKVYQLWEVGAVANNISQFCNNVKIISYLGKSYTNKNFIDKNLNKKIKKSFLYINGPTIQKEKYIDKNSGNKIFGFYNFDDSFLDEKSQKKLTNILKKELPKYDIVIAANYGHGLINNRIANLISRKTKFLVVNSQINAANILHHNLNLFRNTTCTIINEGELRHEMRDKHSRLEQLMKNLSVNLKTKFIVVTRGDNGSKLLDVKKIRLSTLLHMPQKLSIKLAQVIH